MKHSCKESLIKYITLEGCCSVVWRKKGWMNIWTGDKAPRPYLYTDWPIISNPSTQTRPIWAMNIQHQATNRHYQKKSHAANQPLRIRFCVLWLNVHSAYIALSLVIICFTYIWKKAPETWWVRPEGIVSSLSWEGPGCLACLVFACLQVTAMYCSM